MSERSELPQIIQGGMGVGVSGWTLARAVSQAGQLGVVSGTMLDTSLVRRLQDGDPGGHMQRAAAHFPIPGAVEPIMKRYFRPNGRAPNAKYALLPLFRRRLTAERERLIMLGNFIEVWLAKEGHNGVVGINLLTKTQMPNMASLYGAMLAGVDYVLMGAGIPREIPGVLDALAEHKLARLKMEIEDERPDGSPPMDAEYLELDPMRQWANAEPIALQRPKFLAIVSAASLASTLARKSTGRVDGFVVEGPTAGGHNAPPRGQMQLNEQGEPVYGPRDVVDLAGMRALNLPFWLAGGTGSPDALVNARAEGAAGIQVGTLFAYADESGILPELKRRVLQGVLNDSVAVITDPRASPTGYPFKIVSESEPVPPAPTRTRICDLGYLRVAVRNESGIVYRCPAEPVDTYVAKGGTEENTVGRQCLCNGLASTVGFAQERDDYTEPPLITSGDDLVRMKEWLGERVSYTVADVLRYLMTNDEPAHRQGILGAASGKPL